MVYRKRRSYRRRPRRRSFRRRSFRRRRSNFDGVVKQKCILTADVQANNNAFGFSISWRDITDQTGNQCWTVERTGEFRQFAALFREYTVSHMSFRFQPNKEIQVPDNQGLWVLFSVGSVNSASAPVPATAPPTLVKCPDYKSTSALRDHKRSYKVGKYFRSRDISWYNISSTVPASADMKTFVGGTVNGARNGMPIGTITI